MVSKYGYDGRAIANYIIEYCGQNRRSVTNLALQKIIYFCHVWSLLNLNRPLVKHEFEAWQHGPVLQYLYREFKEFDGAPIDRLASALDHVTGKRVIARCDFDADVLQLLDKVISFYSRLSAGQLVEMSHVVGGPWYVVWNHNEKINPGMKIKNEQIIAFYSRAISQLGIQ